MKTIAATVALSAASLSARELPQPAAILASMRTANNHFMKEWPEVGKPIVTNRERPSNIWTRAVYYEGLMAFQAIEPNPACLDYAVKWAEFHQWGMRSGDRTRNADDQCCLQTYADLYRLDPRPERIRAMTVNLDAMVASDKVDDWSWVDAIQMAMPAMAKFAALTHDPRYLEKAHAIYTHTKTQTGGGLYNATEHLWWRDKDFVPPYREPNGKNCYWSRGNGWVFAALVRVLDEMPAGAPHRAEYEQTVKEMAGALAACQRADGFWNASLLDPDNFGGKETSGTALFTYGMAWGLRHHLLDEKTYRPIVARAWHALATEALHPDGFLGYVQGTGKQPSEGRPILNGKPQPIGPDDKPDFDDFGLGCFLLAGSEVWRLSGG
jgi:rhamnogalacturonyl hydrolase YesR